MEHESLFDKALLTGPGYQDGLCAIELLHLVVVGRLADETPEPLTVCCAALSPLEQGPWRDHAHRTAVLIPYLRRTRGLYAGRGC